MNLPPPPEPSLSTPGEVGMVGTSATLESAFRWLAKAAPMQSPVVIEGEPGVGKLLAAQALHALSPRRRAPLVVLQGPELTGEALLEAMKHESRAETPGTVVIRRVESLDARVQPLLLRVLKERPGEERRTPRLVATAFRSLQQAVKDGAFREDLYFRLSVLLLTLPPLRERKEDIPSLVRHALGNDPEGKPRTLTFPAMERLLAYPWPGNVRELLEVVTGLRERASDAELGLAHLPEYLARGPTGKGESLALHPPPTLLAHGLLPPLPPAAGGPSSRSMGEAVFPVSEHLPFKEAKAQLLVAFEKEYLARLLERFGGSITRVAQGSGLHRKSIERLVKKYQLKQRRRRSPPPTSSGPKPSD